MITANNKTLEVKFQEERIIMSAFRDDFVIEKKPTSYMKFKVGTNKIRILSPFIDGWEGWENQKPIRYRPNEKPDNAEGLKQFIACVVWNYEAKRAQVLQITQATVMKALHNLTKDSDWGEPYDYDIKIVRIGDDLRSKYQVNPSPKLPVDPAIVAAVKAKPCNLDALFVGGDPFDEWETYSPIVFTGGQPVVIAAQVQVNKEDPFKKKISNEDAIELSNMIGDDAEFREKFIHILKASFGSPKLTDIPLTQFQRLRQVVAEHNMTRLENEMKKAG